MVVVTVVTDCHLCLERPVSRVVDGVRPCVTAKLPVLRPWFWNLILLNLAPASCYFIVSLGGRARCKHPFIGRRKMWNCQFVQHLRAAYVQTVEQFSQRASETGDQSFAMGTFWDRGEDAGVSRAPFKQCWFVREEAEHTRISLPTPVLNIAGSQAEVDGICKGKRERKAPQPKARTESEEEARRERYGQGIWIFFRRPVPFGGSPLWDLLVYHVTIAAPYPGGIDPRLAVYARTLFEAKPSHSSFPAPILSYD